MINRREFFEKIKSLRLFTTLSQSQVDGMTAILDSWEEVPGKDVRKLAYVLATVYHECARRMQPIEEFGKGKNRPYGSKLKMNRKPYSTPDKLYYGRGFVQLTWYENYEKAGKKLGLDLLSNPELVLALPVATDVLIIGMEEGWFTGRKLSDYIGNGCDFVRARHIINGTDCDDLIATYAEDFLKSLT